MARRYWTCPKCKIRLPRIKQKCTGCGKARPERRTAAQKALTDPYEVWAGKYGEVCNICGRKATANRRLDRDHDHRSSLPRGLLCVKCNRALPSWVDAAWLRAAAAYLERGPL